MKVVFVKASQGDIYTDKTKTEDRKSSLMKVAGHKETKLYELEGYGHGLTEPAFPLLLNEVSRIVEKKENIKNQTIN